MTLNRELDDVLREWVDHGDERLPHHNLAAALAEIETTPQRGARPALLEGLLMRLQPAAPILGLAAVVIAAVALYAAFSRGNVGGPDATPTPTRIDGSYSTSEFAVPFSAELQFAAEPEGWEVVETTTAVTLTPAPGSGYEIIVLDRSATQLVSGGRDEAFPADAIAALDALDGASAEQPQRPDLDEAQTMEIAGMEVPWIWVTFDEDLSGTAILRTDDVELRGQPADQGWWVWDVDNPGDGDVLIVYRGDDLGLWLSTIAETLGSMEFETES